MVDQNTFMETLRSVAEIVQTAPVPMSEKEILSYFNDMDLSEEQKQMVLAYLTNPANFVQDEKDGSNEADSDSEDTMEDGEEEKSSKVFQMYLDELALLPKYSEEEMNLLYKKLLQGEEVAVTDISNAWLPKVLTVADKYMEPKLMVEDLVQEGNMALFLKLSELCGSMDKVDVEESLLQAVEEGIMNYASEMSSERELEETVIGKMSLVHAAQKMLSEELGKEPTIAELSEYTKMPEEELKDLLDMMNPEGAEK